MVTTSFVPFSALRTYNLRAAFHGTNTCVSWMRHYLIYFCLDTCQQSEPSPYFFIDSPEQATKLR
eukprot:m.268819 g.268819  ORF g.268819 m.268819 type:complete len:65 (-) comp15662_c1_seq1:922-1116(-)